MKNRNLINDFLNHNDIISIVTELFNEMREQKERTIYKDEYSQGRCIGNKADIRINYWTNKYSDLTYRKGAEGSEPDCMCDAAPKFSFEFKSSSNNKVPGAKSHATTERTGTKYKNDHEKIYVFVHYDIKTLEVQRIYVGTLGPNNWSCSRKPGSCSAYVTNKTFDEQFIRIY